MLVTTQKLLNIFELTQTHNLQLFILFINFKYSFWKKKIHNKIFKSIFCLIPLVFFVLMHSPSKEFYKPAIFSIGIRKSHNFIFWLDKV
jgi:hypothetical protein